MLRKGVRAVALNQTSVEAHTDAFGSMIKGAALLAFGAAQRDK